MKSVIVFLKNVWNAQRNADWVNDHDYWREQYYDCRSKLYEATAENAALRKQVNQRDASGRFAKKNAS